MLDRTSVRRVIMPIFKLVGWLSLCLLLGCSTMADDNNPFGPMLPQNWSKDSRGFWWMPSESWKVDKDMRFPMHVDNVEKALQGMGDRGQPGMTREAASW